ncbi:hypothetical protein [Caballeronia sordidicola]|uniref:hypothetical protein n=1 Tax=Caballeronia sordidicola TaxID=196367 RepID=UPI000AB85047|nr:hypothetical protein [Caballeronia sordidicola]
MNPLDPSTASASTSKLLLAILIGCSTVLTACPPKAPETPDTTRVESTSLVKGDLR